MLNLVLIQWLQILKNQCALYTRDDFFKNIDSQKLEECNIQKYMLCTTNCGDFNFIYFKYSLHVISKENSNFQ